MTTGRVRKAAGLLNAKELRRTRLSEPLPSAATSQGQLSHPHLRQRSHSAHWDMGRETVGSGRDTQLWSGGQKVGEQYQDVSNIGEIEATMRGRRTLEMTARHTLKPWDNDDKSTQEPWDKASRSIAKNARNKVSVILHPTRMKGLLYDPKTSEDKGGGISWRTEQPTIRSNKDVHTLALKDSQTLRTVTIQRGGSNSWESHI